MWVRRAASHRFACAWRRSTSKVEAATLTRKVTSSSCTSWLARKLICSISVAYVRARCCKGKLNPTSSSVASTSKKFIQARSAWSELYNLHKRQRANGYRLYCSNRTCKSQAVTSKALVAAATSNSASLCKEPKSIANRLHVAT